MYILFVINYQKVMKNKGFTLIELLVVVAIIGSHLIVQNLNVQFYDTLDYPFRYGIVILVNCIAFLVFKTYSGILRLSTFIDGIKSATGRGQIFTI
jgi:prepilin-type N-terminal cleavage/methylation domain-containing protein